MGEPRIKPNYRRRVEFGMSPEEAFKGTALLYHAFHQLLRSGPCQPGQPSGPSGADRHCRQDQAGHRRGSDRWQNGIDPGYHDSGQTLSKATPPLNPYES
jgi:hypothetical protein